MSRLVVVAEMLVMLLWREYDLTCQSFIMSGVLAELFHDYSPEFIPEASPTHDHETKGRSYDADDYLDEDFDGMAHLSEEELFFMTPHKDNNGKTIHVKDCYIDPREMEIGVWPPDYTISDHGFLSCQYEFK